MNRAERRRAADPTEATGTAARPSITAIAELLAHFDGVSGSWEKQVRGETPRDDLQAARRSGKNFDKRETQGQGG